MRELSFGGFLVAGPLERLAWQPTQKRFGSIRLPSHLRLRGVSGRRGRREGGRDGGGRVRERGGERVREGGGERGRERERKRGGGGGRRRQEKCE